MARRSDLFYDERFEGLLELQNRIFGSNTLEYYNAKSKLSTVKRWYNMVSTPFDGRRSMKLLEKEAEEVNGMYRSSFIEAKAQAETKYNIFPFLTHAECVVVIMYIGELQRSFYKEYNEACRDGIWEPYEVYTTHLMSALVKLAKENPLPQGQSLYRGIREKPGPLTVNQIFWKSFTSTSLKYEVAKEFAGRDGVVLEFQPPHSRYAARVGKLSPFPEEEVILLPFEAFDVLNGKSFQFKTSKTQELLN